MTTAPSELSDDALKAALGRALDEETKCIVAGTVMPDAEQVYLAALRSEMHKRGLHLEPRKRWPPGSRK